MKIEFKLKSLGHSMYRAKVMGGWIILHENSNYDEALSESMVFIPDPNHEWEIE